MKLLTGRENVKVSIPTELSELDACPLNTQYLSANVGEGGKSSRKLLRAVSLFQIGVRARCLLPFFRAWKRYLRQGDCERVFADVAGLALDEP